MSDDLTPVVAEMFMANEPLKHFDADRGDRGRGKLQRCLWRMSH